MTTTTTATTTTTTTATRVARRSRLGLFLTASDRESQLQPR
jgi:hypothetical protein